MDFLLDWQHHHRLNVILLSVIGLWPYGNKFILQLKRFFGSVMAFSCCSCQLATFFTMDYTSSLLLRNAPGIFIGCSILQKYTLFLAVGDCIKKVTESINGDWKDLSNEEEIQIVKKYIERGKFHTKVFAMFICPTTISLFLAPLSSVFLDILMPLNQSRSRDFPIMFELFVDQKKYFFLDSLMFDGAIIVGGLIFVSTEGLLIVYIQHACALFEVTRHCKTIREDFLPSYMILLVLGVLGMSTHLYRCTQTFVMHEFGECLISAVFCFAILGYMFYFNFMAQGLLISSGDIFHVLYSTNWYASSISTRKSVIFCMLNSVKPVRIDVCGLYFPSYEGFSLVSKIFDRQLMDICHSGLLGCYGVSMVFLHCKCISMTVSRTVLSYTTALYSLT